MASSKVITSFSSATGSFLTPLVELTYFISLKPFLNKHSWDFPGGAVVKNPPANAGDTGSSPDLGRSHMLQSN